LDFTWIIVVLALAAIAFLFSLLFVWKKKQEERAEAERIALEAARRLIREQEAAAARQRQAARENVFSRIIPRKEPAYVAPRTVSRPTPKPAPARKSTSGTRSGRMSSSSRNDYDDNGLLIGLAVATAFSDTSSNDYGSSSSSYDSGSSSSSDSGSSYSSDSGSSGGGWE
jgi:uncharacterized membrane protein YgcG